MRSVVIVFLRCFAAALAAVLISLPLPVRAVEAIRISVPPLEERWFSIQVDNEQVGFYRQTTTKLPAGDGYRIEGSGSVRMKIMGFTKESSSRERYRIGTNLALKELEVEQTINGGTSQLHGLIVPGGLQVRRTADGKTTQRMIKIKGDLVPGPALNLVPLLKGAIPGKVYRAQTFDPEEQTVKEVKITFLGEVATPDGQTALALRNNLYPFVDNDIWVDRQGSTLFESVRDGLVVTRTEPAEKMAAFISGMALAKKDLIYDFSLVRLSSPLQRSLSQLTGLWVAIDGYAEQIPLLTGGWHQSEREANGRLLFRTGTLRTTPPAPAGPPAAALVQPSEGIESDAAEIIAKAAELTAGLPDELAKVQALVAWTAAWLEDSIEDGGSALKSLSNKKGNCQTHAKLFTALARAAGIPTRFVSGLVSQDGKGFLYHSWAESWLQGRWLAVDPTFHQVPADPTHLAFFEGNRLQDLTPLVGIIGKIKLTILEER